MVTIQMNSKTGFTASVQLPAPSGATVALTNGIGSVNAQDVPIALLAGWEVMAGQNWPGAMLKHMALPTGGLWPANGTITSPDGQTITITNSVALVPIAWVNYYIGMGWKVTGWGE